MKRTVTDYFDGFNELFDIAVRAGEAQELMRRSTDRRGSLYRALVNEFLPPIERRDILDMINALHGLNVAAAELKSVRTLYPDTGAGQKEAAKRSSDMLNLTGRAVRELRNFKKPSKLLELANNIHREYCSAVPELDRLTDTGTDRERLSRERELRDKTGKICAACERIACCAEQIVANNV